ncbi:MAG: LPS export ABC transporter periplasmic protein LptC [Leptolyngbyaceae cyanobacterium HOT.MB2.61]|jgi:LPS export ABC transporter protein LptC|nr:LPS export ABC transporter periplasmic protein LptC [Leptolyngbyaceae cyanobacterium HOT.MB2.61]
MSVLLTLRRNRLAALACLKAGLIGLLLLTASCGGGGNRTAEKIARDSKQVEEFDNRLTFNDLSLEGFDKQGRLWWKVKAKQATYSKDKQVARITQPAGELYQDGKAIIEVSAQSGEVQQDGEKIFLRGQITAKDKRNGMILKGGELEWQPQKDLLMVRNSVTGDYKGTNVSAKGGRFLTRSKRLELEGNVIASSKDPNAQFQSDRVVWLVEQKKLMSDRPLQIAGNLPGKAGQNQATSGRGTVDLNTKTATLSQGTQITLFDPPIQVSGNSLVWNITGKTVVANEPVTIVNPKERVTLTADRGNLDITTRTAYLTGNVRGFGQKNQSHLGANRIIYNLTTQDFVAEGGVTYRQADPPFNLAGPRAIGRVQDQTIVVSGGRVVTEFIPDTVIR